MVDDLHDAAADRHRLIEIDPGLDAHFVAHVQHVLGRHVSGRAGDEWAAAHTGERAVIAREAGLHASEDVGDAQSARVVEVKPPRHLWVGLGHLRADRVDLRRVGLTGGVGERDLMDADGKVGVHDLLDVGERDLTVPRRTERHGDRTGDLNAGASGRVHAGAEAGDGFGGRAVEISKVVCLARGNVQLDLFAAAGRSALHALEVCNQRAVFHTLAAQQGGKDLVRVRHLRHGFRAHERADLDDGKARVRGGFDQLLLFLHGEDAALILQAVPRADLAEGDVIDKIQCHIFSPRLVHHVRDQGDELRENHQNSNIDHCHENKGGNVLDDTLDLGVGRVRRNVQADADRRSQVADSNVADNSNAKRDLVDAGSLHDGKQNGNEHDLHGRTLKEKAADEKYKVYDEHDPELVVDGVAEKGNDDVLEVVALHDPGEQAGGANDEHDVGSADDAVHKQFRKVLEGHGTVDE